jgi:hypothetical protein
MEAFLFIFCPFLFYGYSESVPISSQALRKLKGVSLLNLSLVIKKAPNQMANHFTFCIEICRLSQIYQVMGMLVR